jgi:hypothetical protein
MFLNNVFIKPMPGTAKSIYIPYIYVPVNFNFVVNKFMFLCNKYL